MMKQWKKWLCLALAALTLAGCTAGGPADDPRGRYVEDALAQLPQDVQLLGSHVDAQGGITLFTGEPDAQGTMAYRAQSLVDGELKATDLPELTAFAQDQWAQSIGRAPGGDLYALLSDASGRSTLGRSQSGQPFEALTIAEWQPDDTDPPEDDPSAGEAGGISSNAFSFSSGPDTIRPYGIVPLDDGFLAPCGQDGLYHYDLAGQLVRIYPASAFDGSVAAWGREVAVGDWETGAITVYDLDSGSKTQSVDVQDLDFNAVVGMDAQGLYLADKGGIRRQEGSGWQQVVDGGLTSLMMPTLGLRGVLSDGSGLFYGLLEGENLALTRYRFDSDMPLKPNKELNIFSLYPSNTLSQAIGEYQRQNPDVRVNLQVALDADGSATAEDVIRALNTELVAGKGPDLIVLDGLPLEAYIEKGVLRDLTTLVGDLKAEGGLLPGLADTYAKDGKVYGVPTRFTVPIMLGHSDVIQYITSLQALVAECQKWQGGDPPLLGLPGSLMDGGTVLPDYYDMCAGGFMAEDGSVDAQALAAFFEDILALDNSLKADLPEMEEGQQTMAFAVGSSSGFEAIDTGCWNVRDGRALAHTQVLAGMMSLRILCADLGPVSGMRLESLFEQNSYIPQRGIGVVAGGQNVELAEDFIRTALGRTVQDAYLYDGFPVGQAALEAMLAEHLRHSQTDERLDDMGFMALCQRLSAPIFVDQVVKDAVLAQAEGLVSGQLTPQAAADAVAQSTRLYLAE